MTETRRTPWVSDLCLEPVPLSRTPEGHRLVLVERCCDFCGKPIEGRRAKRYCDSVCAAAPKKAGQAEIDAWLAGDLTGHTGATLKLKPWVREWVLREANHACSECGWNKVHPEDGRCLVEVDHKDGDAANSRPENLRALCPCCHAMTPTFRRRNAVSARNRTPVVAMALTA